MKEITELLDRWPSADSRAPDLPEAFLREAFMLLWRLEIAFKLGWIR